MPWWASLLLVLSHIAVFVLGAVTYHGIRILSVRPLGPLPTKAVSEAKLNEIALKAARLSTAGDRFGNQFAPLPDMNVVRRQIIPDGDGRSKEETFVPAK
jgi:hypothetical protein